MKKCFIYVIAAISALVVSCNKEVDTPDNNTGKVDQNLVSMTFKAALEGDDTKTTLNTDGTVAWAAGDAVKFVWELDGTPSEGVSDELVAGDIDGDGAASFTASVPAEFAMTEAAYEEAGGKSLHLYAVYPSSREVEYVYNNEDKAMHFHLTVPTTQDGSFKNASIALAKWNKDAPAANLDFKNLCGLLQIKIDDPNVCKIVLHSDDYIAGKMDISFTGPAVKERVDGKKDITVNVPGAGIYYVAVLPTDASKGIGVTNMYVELFDSSGNLIGNKATTNALSVARKQIRKLGTIATGFDDRFYVKTDGTGYGTSWDDAASYASLSTPFTANTKKTIYMAAGEYTATEIAPGISTTSANVTIMGGYPSSASGHDISRRDVTANQVVLNANSANRIWVLQRGTWKIDGITFKNAKRSGSDTGSALVIEGASGTSVTASNCYFIGNNNTRTSGTTGGGAVRVSHATLNLNSCYFYGNSATGGHGGAIFVNVGGTLNADNCIFGDADDATKMNSVATNNPFGGCIYVIGSANLSNCSFVGNTSAYRGGAIALDASGSLDIDSCTFQANSSVLGGAIYVHAITSTASLEVDNTLFMANTVTTTGGGAVGVSGDSKTYTGMLKFRNCLFDGNTASNSGGAVWDNGGSASFTDCSFARNMVTETVTPENATGGGAVFCGTTSGGTTKLYFNRCFFANNQVAAGRWGHHIAITSTGYANVGINNCVIRAPWGLTLTDTSFKGIGALLMTRSPLVMVNTTMFSRTGNPMIEQGATTDGACSFINSIVVNGAGTPNSFYNYDSTKYLALNYVLYSQIKSGSQHTAVSANSLAAVTYTDLGWAKDGNGTYVSTNDVRDHIYFYDWSGSIDGKTISYPTLQQVKDLVSGTSSVGDAFLEWLEGDDQKVGTLKALEMDIRGEARNKDAMWPGSYEGSVTKANIQGFTVK